MEGLEEESLFLTLEQSAQIEADLEKELQHFQFLSVDASNLSMSTDSSSEFHSIEEEDDLARARGIPDGYQLNDRDVSRPSDYLNNFDLLHESTFKIVPSHDALLKSIQQGRLIVSSSVDDMNEGKEQANDSAAPCPRKEIVLSPPVPGYREAHRITVDLVVSSIVDDCISLCEFRAKAANPLQLDFAKKETPNDHLSIGSSRNTPLQKAFESGLDALFYSCIQTAEAEVSEMKQRLEMTHRIEQERRRKIILETQQEEKRQQERISYFASCIIKRFVKRNKMQRRKEQAITALQRCILILAKNILLAQFARWKWAVMKERQLEQEREEQRKMHVEEYCYQKDLELALYAVVKLQHFNRMVLSWKARRSLRWDQEQTPERTRVGNAEAARIQKAWRMIQSARGATTNDAMKPEGSSSSIIKEPSRENGTNIRQRQIEAGSAIFEAVCWGELEKQKATCCVENILYCSQSSSVQKNIDRVSEGRSEFLSRWIRGVSHLRRHYGGSERLNEFHSFCSIASQNLIHKPLSLPLPSNIDGESSSARKGIDKELLQSFGVPSNLRSFTLTVEAIEDASAFVRLGATGLTSLCLNVNRISPDLRCFAGLRQLRILSLRDNCLQSLIGIEELTSLEDLDVESNRLEKLSPFGDTNAAFCLPHLRRLNVNANRIKSLPSCMRKTLALQTFSLYQNLMTSLPPKFLDGLSRLVSLDLGRNQLKDSESLGHALSMATMLRRIVLSQNRLNSLPSPLILPLLDELWLSANVIHSVQSWVDDQSSWLPCLADLHLQDNCITSFHPTSLAGVSPNLKTLDVSFNDLTCAYNIASALHALEFLESLNISDNPLTSNEDTEEIILCTLPQLKVFNGTLMQCHSSWAAMASTFTKTDSVATTLSLIDQIIAQGHQVPLLHPFLPVNVSLWAKCRCPARCRSCGFEKRIASVEFLESESGSEFNCPLCCSLLLRTPATLPLDWKALLRCVRADKYSLPAALHQLNYVLSLCRSFVAEARKSRKVNGIITKELVSECSNRSTGETLDSDIVADGQIQALLMHSMLDADGGECKLRVFRAWSRFDCLSEMSTYNYVVGLQCFIRCKLARKRASRCKARTDASIHIQRYVRDLRIRLRMQRIQNVARYVDNELDHMLEQEQDVIFVSTLELDDDDLQPMHMTGVEKWTLASACKDESRKHIKSDSVAEVSRCNSDQNQRRQQITRDHEELEPKTGEHARIEPKVLGIDVVRSHSNLQKLCFQNDEMIKEWGFSDPRTAETMLKRRKHLNQGRRRTAREQEMADPINRYNKLMKKVNKKG